MLHSALWQQWIPAVQQQLRRKKETYIDVLYACTSVSVWTAGRSIWQTLYAALEILA